MTLPRLERRPADSHKGDYGHVLVVGGARGMLGAPVLCAEAALRTGSGLVTAAVPAECYDIVASKLTDAMTAALPSCNGSLLLSAAWHVLELLERCDVLAIGCGIGRATATVLMVQRVIREARKPVVLDADGLFAVAQNLACLGGRGSSLVLTPHPGEMARLCGIGIADVQRNRAGVAARFAHDFSTTLVLKGHRTVIASPDSLHENTTGNPAMATGGMGDVLTGIIASLIGQGLEPFDAACLGAWLHGRAGDLGRDQLGNSLSATDLLGFLPQALREAAP